MARIGFTKGAYQSSNVSAAAQECINLYFEDDESGDGKSVGSLLPTPGLAVFDNTFAGGNACRGGIEINGRAFVVIDGNLCEIFAGGGNTGVARGQVANDGKPASLAASAEQVLIASGGQGYCFNLQTGAFSGAIAAIAGVIQVGYCDGFFVALVAASAQFFVSNTLDATTWDLTNTAIVSVFPGNIVAMVLDHRELCLLGNRQTVCYYDSGNLFPFDVVPGGFVELGGAATFGFSKADNSYLWWGQDERGSRVGWRMNNYQPSRISRYSIEAELATYPTIADAVSYACQINGHTFWITRFPTANKTWGYDIATGEWFRMSYRDPETGLDGAHRSAFHIYAFDKHLVGDPLSGTIYQMSMPVPNGDGTWQFMDDFGNNIRRIRRSPYIVSENQWIAINAFELEAEAGLGQIASGGNPQGVGSFILQDANGVLWSVSITDLGVIQTANGALGIPQTFILRDNVTGTTCWIIGISITGAMTATATVFNPLAPQTLPMGSTPGALQTGIQVDNNGNVQGVAPVAVPRAPMGQLRWSKDRAKTWSNPRDLSLGAIGQVATRIRTLRLGRVWGTIGLVPEFSYSEKIPIRITDAYIDATPDFAQAERIKDRYRAAQ